MSDFVLDASYTLTWCFPDRATPNTDASLRRLEARTDRAVVPWVWQVEIGNALGKAASKGKVTLPRALEIWEELLLLPIRQVAIGNIPQLIRLAVQQDLALYDSCYLQLANLLHLPIATNDHKLIEAARTTGVDTIVP